MERWIKTEHHDPTWYKNVEIKLKNGVVKKNFHRLYDEFGENYFGTQESDEIVFESEVTEYRYI